MSDGLRRAARAATGKKLTVHRHDDSTTVDDGKTRCGQSCVYPGGVEACALTDEPLSSDKQWCRRCKP